MQKLATICTTIILIVAVGGWVYVQKQSIAQKDRALTQQADLTKYQQEQENARNAANNKAKCQDAGQLFC